MRHWLHRLRIRLLLRLGALLGCMALVGCAAVTALAPRLYGPVTRTDPELGHCVGGGVEVAGARVTGLACVRLPVSDGGLVTADDGR